MRLHFVPEAAHPAPSSRLLTKPRELSTRSPQRYRMARTTRAWAATLLTVTKLVRAYDLDLTSPGGRAHFSQTGVCPADLVNRLYQSGCCRYGR